MYKKQNTNLSVLSGYITARRECMREICHSCPGLLDGGGRGANKMKRHQMREIRESENQQSRSEADLWPCTWRQGQRSLLLCPSCHLLLTTPSCFTCTASVSYTPLFLSVDIILPEADIRQMKKMYSLYWHEGTIKIVFLSLLLCKHLQLFKWSNEIMHVLSKGDSLKDMVFHRYIQTVLWHWRCETMGLCQQWDWSQFQFVAHGCLHRTSRSHVWLYFHNKS